MARPTRTPVQGGEHAEGTLNGCVDLDGGGAAATRIAGPSIAIGGGTGASGAHHLGVCRGHGQQDRREAVAPSRRARSANGAGDLSPIGWAVWTMSHGLGLSAQSRMRRWKTRSFAHWKPPPGATHWSTRDMEKAVGPEPYGHQSHLAHVRIAAASKRDVQALERSAVDRESPRHRGSVFESTRARRPNADSTKRFAFTSISKPRRIFAPA